MAKTEIGEIYYRITGDNSGLKRSLNESDTHAKSFTDTLFKVGKVLAGAFIVKQIFEVGKAIIGVASDANETASKFGVVFSSISDRANKTAADISDSYGLSRNAAKEYLSGVGDILKGLEFTQSASLDTSASIVKLSADLVSFKNYAGGVEGAQRAITSALLGEREALKGLGIAISEADLKQFAADSGKVWENLSRQEQATLTLALITERAGNAIGDFERTQYGFANQLRIAEGNLNNLQVTLGTKMLPVATLGVIAFNEIVKSVDASAVSFGDWLTSVEGSEQVASFLAAAIGGLYGIFSAMEPVIDALGDGFSAIWNALTTGIDDLTGTNDEFKIMSSLMVTLASVLKIGGIALAGIITLILDMGKAFWETGKTASSFIGLISGDITWNDFKKQVSTAGNSITKLGDDIIKTTKSLTGEIGKAWDNFGKDVDRNNQKALKSSLDMHDRIQNAVKLSLTANQKTNQEELKSHEQTEKSKTGLTLAQAKEREEAEKKSKKERDEARKNEVQAESDKLKKIQQIASELYQGLNDILSGIAANIRVELTNTIADIEKVSNAQLAQLDAQMYAELERLGLLEDTELERLQKRLDEAIAKGDTETAAELQDEIARLKIKNEYADKKKAVEDQAAKDKANAEYKANHSLWEIQMIKASADLAMAIMAATISGLSFKELAPVMVPVLVGIASAAGIANIAAISKSEPQKPAFAQGGIVPGSAFQGDQINARVNSGEMILTQEQQAQLFKMANGSSGGGSYFTFYIDSEMLYDKFYVDSKNGKFKINGRGVTSL